MQESVLISRLWWIFQLSAPTPWIRESGFCNSVLFFRLVCTDVRLASAWADILILCIFDIYEFIRHVSVLGEYEHSNSINMGPQTQNGDFFENGCNDFDSVSTIYKDHVGFEVLTALVTNSSIIREKTSCSPLEVNRRFGWTCRLHLQGRRIREARSQRESMRQAEGLLGLFIQFWRWTRHVPPKRRLTFNGLHDIISQRIEFFIEITSLNKK
jgi:hypothetical protein